MRYLVYHLIVPRAEEEAAARAKLEKENRDLHSQLQEMQDDLESEKEVRMKVDKQRRVLNDELESLRDMLEESESSTAAQQEIRTQRENELALLKRTLEEETAGHEAAITSLRQKHAKSIDDLNEQLEAAKKVINLNFFLLLSLRCNKGLIAQVIIQGVKIFLGGYGIIYEVNKGLFCKSLMTS